MNKISTGFVLVALFAAQTAFAQAYYPITSQTSYAGGCVQITHDLSVGSKGSDVLQLQRFIVSKNYPGGGNWMLTSNFGQATRAGVINFQMDMHLPQTGVLDASTRAALSNTTCGYSTPMTPIYTTPSTPWYAAPTQTWYNNSNYTYGLSGQGNNYNNNCSTVYGGSNCQCGWYTVAGQNYFNNCLTGQGGYNNPSSTIYPNNNYPYNPYNNQNNTYAPTISNVSGPTSLNVNTTGTWQVSFYNSNASYSTNYTSVSVNWGDTYNGYVNAQAPQQIYGNGSQTASFTHAYAQSGTYTVTFTVSNAYGSNTSSITLHVGSNSSTPNISTISPIAGSVGTLIQITGSGFTGDNVVHFGTGGKMHVTSQSGNYVYFTVPQYLTPCDVTPTGSYCAQYLQTVTPGQYPIYITVNSNGLPGQGVNSNTLTFTVQ